MATTPQNTLQNASTSKCWVNAFIGKNVHVTFPNVSPSSADHTFVDGKALRIDQFGHRHYLVVERFGSEASVNIDYIMMIEENK